MNIDSHQASLFHFALTAAIEAAQAQIRLKSAAPFVEAIALQISAYKAEQAKLEAAFPVLKPEPPKEQQAK